MARSLALAARVATVAWLAASVAACDSWLSMDAAAKPLDPPAAK
jgi:hypothetical protein